MWYANQRMKVGYKLPNDNLTEKLVALKRERLELLFRFPRISALCTTIHC